MPFILPTTHEWVTIPEAMGEALFAAVIAKAGVPIADSEGHEVLVYKAGFAKDPSYAKRWRDPSGSTKYAYAHPKQGIGAAAVSPVATPEHFTPGARVSSGADGGRYHVHSHDPTTGHMVVSHTSNPSHKVTTNSHDFAKTLQEAHAPAIAQHKEHVLGSIAKVRDEHARLLGQAAKHGYAVPEAHTHLDAAMEKIKPPGSAPRLSPPAKTATAPEPTEHPKGLRPALRAPEPKAPRTKDPTTRLADIAAEKNITADRIREQEAAHKAHVKAGGKVSTVEAVQLAQRKLHHAHLENEHRRLSGTPDEPPVPRPAEAPKKEAKPRAPKKEKAEAKKPEPVSIPVKVPTHEGYDFSGGAPDKPKEAAPAKPAAAKAPEAAAKKEAPKAEPAKAEAPKVDKQAEAAAAKEHAAKLADTHAQASTLRDLVAKQEAAHANHTKAGGRVSELDRIRLEAQKKRLSKLEGEAKKMGEAAPAGAAKAAPTTPAKGAPAKPGEAAAEHEHYVPSYPSARVEHDFAGKSSNLKRTHWTPDSPGSPTGTMRMHFANGEAGDYAGVHHDDYMKVVNAHGSHGKAYNEHIKGLHDYVAKRVATPEDKKETSARGSETRAMNNDRQQKAASEFMAQKDGKSSPSKVEEAAAKLKEAKPAEAKTEPTKPEPSKVEQAAAKLKESAGLTPNRFDKLDPKKFDVNGNPRVPKGEAKAETTTPAKAPEAVKMPSPGKPLTDAEFDSHVKKYREDSAAAKKAEYKARRDAQSGKGKPGAHEAAQRKVKEIEDGFDKLAAAQREARGPDIDEDDNSAEFGGHTHIKGYRKDAQADGSAQSEPKAGRFVVHAHDDDQLVHNDDHPGDKAKPRLTQSEILGYDHDNHTVTLRSEQGTEHTVDARHLKNGVIERSPAEKDADERQQGLFIPKGPPGPSTGPATRYTSKVEEAAAKIKEKAAATAPAKAPKPAPAKQPEPAKEAAAPSAETPSASDILSRAKSTYGLNDKEHALVEKKAHDLGKHLAAGDTEKANAHVKQSVESVLAGMRNMSPSSARRHMKEAEAKAAPKAPKAEKKAKDEPAPAKKDAEPAVIDKKIEAKAPEKKAEPKAEEKKPSKVDEALERVRHAAEGPKAEKKFPSKEKKPSPEPKGDEADKAARKLMHDEAERKAPGSGAKAVEDKEKAVAEGRAKLHEDFRSALKRGDTREALKHAQTLKARQHTPDKDVAEFTQEMGRHYRTALDEGMSPDQAREHAHKKMKVRALIAQSQDKPKSKLDKALMAMSERRAQGAAGFEPA